MEDIDIYELGKRAQKGEENAMLDIIRFKTAMIKNIHMVMKIAIKPLY